MNDVWYKKRAVRVAFAGMVSAGVLTPMVPAQAAPTPDPSAPVTSAAPSVDPSATPSVDPSATPSSTPSGPLKASITDASGGAGVDGDAVTYFKTPGKFNVNVVNLAGGDNVVVFVNSAEVMNTVASGPEFQLPVDVNAFTNVQVFVNGQQLLNQNVDIDNTAPSGVVLGYSESVDNYGNASHVTGKGVLTLSNATDQSGISSIDLQWRPDSKTAWASKQKGTASDSYALDKDGYYQVVITDELGNTTTSPLSKVSDLLDQVVVTASTKTVIDVKINGSGVQTTPYTSANLEVTFNPSPVLKRAIVTVNGVDVFNEEYPKYESAPQKATIDLSTVDRPAGGKYVIESTAVGLFGLETTASTTTTADFDKPSLGTATIAGSSKVDSGTAYSTAPLVVSLSPADVGTGVKSVVVSYVDASGAAKLVNVNQGASGSYTFTVPDGTNFSATVTDGVDNTVTKTFVEMGLDANNYVVDGTAPVLKRVDSLAASYTSPDGTQWLKSTDVLKFSVDDANLSTVTITVNGVDYPATKGTDGLYSVDLGKANPANGVEYDVSLTAVDKAGNSSVIGAKYSVDSAAPTGVAAKISGSYQDRVFGVYSTKPLTLNASAADGLGTGVKGFKLIDSTGKVVADTADGVFTIPDGSYSVVAYDQVGNETAPVSVKGLIGTKSNSFVVDSEAPTVTVESSKPVIGNWYADDVAFTANFSDNSALFNGSVTINGKVVSSFTEDSISTSHKLVFNTNMATANSDGAYVIEVQGTDAAGNPVTWSQTVRVDRTAPVIDKFVFTSEGYKEGQSITTDYNYGFFFQNATNVAIYVSDSAPSSGVKEVQYTLRDSGMNVLKTGTASVSGGVANVAIPDHFKGYIEAKPVDNVLHEGATKHPSGVITEDRNWYVNTSSLAINLPDSGHKDSKGQTLYNANTTATVPVSQSTAGLRSVEWGIGSETLGRGTVDINGNITSGSGFVVTGRDRNLAIKLDGSLGINGNSNDMKIWVSVVDRAGNTSRIEKTISIDKDAPVIDVTYNQTNANGFYNSNRSAVVRITERNFNASDVKLSGAYGTLGSWRNVGGDVWENTVVFGAEQPYQWGIAYTDMAGNAGKAYNSEKFTVDKTAPKLTVDWNNNDVRNGKYYRKSRTATVTVVDVNFDPAAVHFSGNGSLSGWSHNGNIHTATVSFDKDGEYKFSIDVVDKALNKSNVYSSGDFVVDTTVPVLKVAGAQNGTSYAVSQDVTGTASDKYLDVKNSYFKVTGRSNGNMKLVGGFDVKGGTYTLSALPKDDKWDDMYTVTGKVVDLAGNEAKSDLSYTLNRFGSKFSFTNLDYTGKYFQEMPGDVVMKQVSVDRMDVSGFKIVVLRNGKQVELPSDAYTIVESGGKDGPWVYTVTVKKEFFKDDGKYQVQLYSKSLSGKKESFLHSEYSFVVDHTPPEIIISGVEDGKSYTTPEKTVTVDVRDMSPLDGVDIKLNGAPVTASASGTVYSFSIPAKSEVRDLVVVSKDKAGNEARGEVKDFLITTSTAEALWYNKWIKWAVAAGSAALIGFLLLLWKRRRDEDEEEAKRMALQEEQLRTSGNLDSEKLNSGDIDPDFDEAALAAPFIGSELEPDVEPEAEAEADEVPIDHLLEGVEEDESGLGGDTDFLEGDETSTGLLGDDSSTEMMDEDTNSTGLFEEDDK